MHREIVQNDYTAYIIVLSMVALMVYGKMQMLVGDKECDCNEQLDIIEEETK